MQRHQGVKCFGDLGQAIVWNGVTNRRCVRPSQIPGSPLAADHDIPANERLTMLWVKAQPVIWAYTQSAIRDYHHAEDVLQQVAQQTAASFDEYDPKRSFTAWAMGIAKNKVREQYRRQSRDKLVLSEQALGMISDSFAEDSEYLGGFRRALAWCLSQLNEQARELLSLRYTSDLKPAAIARRCKLNANTVRIRLCRYRSALADCVSNRLAKEESA